MAWRDPWETVDRANALRAQKDAQGINMLSALQGAQTNALQQQQMRTQMDDEMAVREAYKTSAGDPVKLREALTGRGAYKQIQALDKADLERKQTQSVIDKNTTETAVKQAQMERDAIAGIQDQTGWDAFRQGLGQRGARLPAQFNPQLKEQLVLKADDYVKRMTPDYKTVGGEVVDMNPFTNPSIRGYQITPTIGEKESARHNKVAEGISAGQLGVAQGNLGVSRERLAMEKNAPKGQFDAERGVLVDPRTAQAQPVMMNGQPIGPKDKDLTDAQSKAFLFGDRMAKADAIIADLAKKGTTTSVPGSQMGYGVGATINAVSSGNQQSLDQAKRDFINAVLRRESGAVISPQEFDNAEKQYFPQVGDSAQVRAQKAANRKTAQEGIMMEVPARKRPVQPTAEQALTPAEQQELQALKARLRQGGG